MSTGTSVNGTEVDARFTACLDEARSSFTNEVDSNPDLFLAASLQFLHRLLAERTLQYTKLDANDVSTSQPEAEDMQQQGNNTRRQLYFQQIDQIEEYKRQLRSMENFLSTIQFDAEKPMRKTADSGAVMLNETNDFGCSGDLRNFKSTKLHDDSYNFISRTPSPRASNYPYSFLNYNDELSVDVYDGTKIDASGNDFTGQLQTRSVVSTRNSMINNGVQNTASYADLVRNAVSGLARNCRKKHKTRRKKRGANSWLPKTGSMENPEEGKHRRGYQSEVKSEISSESQICDGQGSDIPKEIPLRLQLAREPDASPRKPVTLLVRVPNTVFNLLNRKISNQDMEISSTDHLVETRTEPAKKKKRITSVFRNLLRGRRTPSSTTVNSIKEERPSSATLALEKEGNNAENQGYDTSCNTLIYTLQKSAPCDSFERKTNAELSCDANNGSTIEPRDTERASLKCMFVPPTKSVNGYEKISLNLSPRVISYKLKPWTENAAGNARRTLADDKALRTEVLSNKIEIVKGLRNYRNEKIIPLRCSEGSPQLGNKPGAISQRDVDMFLKLTAEMRKTQVYDRDGNGRHVEIPVEIKRTETPLHLHKIQNVSTEFLDHRVFRQKMKSSQATRNTTKTQRFLEMLVGNLPEGDDLPETEYRKSQELSSSIHSVEDDNFRLLRNNEDSALEVLLRHIVTGTSMMSGTRSYAAEKDTTMQTAPKRQLSKISVCYSSESSSGSDHEIPEFGTKDSTINQDEYGIRNHVQGNENRKPGIQQYFHHCESPEQDYTCTYANNKVVILDKFENKCGNVKILSPMGATITKNENSNLNLSPFSLEDRRRLLPCSRTEVIIEEQNCGTIEAKVKAQVAMDSDKTSLSIRETEKTVFCHPVLSKQIFEDRKVLADALIRWWGPQINYSTTPSSQTQLSTYSVSINNLI